MTTALLLPGNMCDARLWRGADAVVPATIARHGLAVHDVELDCPSITAMADHALATVAGPLLPIGFSLGAIVAVEIARLAPERVRGLVLAGYNATADLPERAAARPRQQAEVRGGGLERVLVDELKPNYLAARHRGDAALLALLLDMGLAGGAEVFARQSEALRTRAGGEAVLPGLTVPVLYLCGAEDRLCPPDWHRRWAAATRDATLRIVAGAGHMLPLEAPADFAAALAAWLHDKELLCPTVS